MENKKLIDEFLLKTGLSPELVELEQESDMFNSEINSSIKGEKSSLAGIPTFLTDEGEINPNTKAIVIDAGGTNFRVAVVSFKEDKTPEIEHFKKYRMPGSDGAISYAEFNRIAVDYMEPVLKESDLVGLCFSYECAIDKSRDGKIVSLSKEIYIDGAIGKPVCEGLNKEIEARGYKPKKFCLLNDTVASMLGGVASSSKDSYDGFVGYIMGTGTNCCYSERCSEITKNPDVVNQPGTMIVNLESGKYNKMKRGKLDEALDANTKMPGDYLFEKMTSGAYQGDLFLSVLKTAADEGLFSEGCAKAIYDLSGLTGMEIDIFCFNPKAMGTLHGLCDNPEDVERMLLLADSFYERIAKLATLQFAGILKRTGKGRYKSRPFCIVAEGTTFYKSKFFRPKLNYYVKQYIEDKMGRYIEFIKVDNATLIGTAAAILLCE